MLYILCHVSENGAIFMENVWKEHGRFFGVNMLNIGVSPMAVTSVYIS